MEMNRPKAMRVLLLSGSQRREKNCPHANSKSRRFLYRMAERLPQGWEVDIEDLGNVEKQSRIQPCNSCVSTSMALCVWPCNCYSKNNTMRPDLMWDLDLYARLDLADAWAIIGPINWYAPSTNLKLLFDRLVCANGGNPRDDLIDNKDRDKAVALEHSPQWKDLNLNHLEGRTAAFFVHGDEGANDMGEDGRPRILRHKEYFDPKEEPFENEREAYRPLVWQCRYSGIEVPDHLWQYQTFGKNKLYSDNQDYDLEDFSRFDRWVDDFAQFVGQKGKVPEGRYPVHNYDRVEHLKG